MMCSGCFFGKRFSTSGWYNPITMIRIDPRDQDKIIPALKRELPEILNLEPVMLAYLFGSVIEGYAQTTSDVDIAVVLSPDYQGSAYERMLLEFKIAESIEDKLGISKADVRSINQAPLTVRGHILTKGHLLYSRDEEYRVDYEVYNRSRYFDFQPVEKMMHEAFLQKYREKG